MKTNRLFLVIIPLVMACGKTVQKTEPICCLPPAARSAAPATVPVLSNTSVYQVQGLWQNAQGDSLPLARLQGKVQVAAMIFTHCGYACPRIVENMQEIEKQLPPAARGRVGFVLITFDVARDSAGQLRAFAESKGLDAGWTLLRAPEDQVRELSMLLNVSYAALPGGSFSHGNVITVLDEKGQIARRVEGLDIDARAVAGEIARMAP